MRAFWRRNAYIRAIVRSVLYKRKTSAAVQHAVLLYAEIDEDVTSAVLTTLQYGLFSTVSQVRSRYCNHTMYATPPHTSSNMLLQPYHIA
jgi:hypothetical protein